MSLDEALHDDKQADLEIARHLAERAGPIALSYFRGDNRTWSKADGSPVSAADVAVDRAIRDDRGRLRPEDGILTEEGEEVGAGQRRRWIIDRSTGLASSSPDEATGGRTSPSRSTASSRSGS